MTLSHEQVQTIIAAAFPGERVEDATERPGDRVAVVLGSGDGVDIQTYSDAEQAATAVAALRRLRGEIDVTLPALRASDPTGDLMGVPYVIHSALYGDRLPDVLGDMSEQELYDLGRSLGSLVYHVHRVACEQYGSLLKPSGAATEREYVLERIAGHLETARSTLLLSDHQVNELSVHFDRQFVPAGTRAALVVGALSVESVLVRQEGARWAIGGMTGWGRALGWSPAWDHIGLLESARSPEYFGLRVGYGNGYDEQTQRTYEQVREAALRPYRELLALEQALAAQARGDAADMRRNRQVLIGLTNVLPTDEEPQRPATA